MDVGTHLLREFGFSARASQLRKDFTFYRCTRKTEAVRRNQWPMRSKFSYSR
jgi:hypothetical protein